MGRNFLKKGFGREFRKKSIFVNIYWGGSGEV